MFGLILAAALAPQPAPATVIRTIGFWKIERDTTHCYASSGFGKNYALMIAIDKAGMPAVALTSDLWTWQNGATLDAVFDLGGKTFSGGVTNVIVEGKERTLVTNMAADFLPAFRAAKRLDFFDDEDGYQDGESSRVNLTFDDNGPIIDALVACTTGLPGAKHLNPAPAAPPAPPKPPAAAPIRPSYVNRPEVILSNDYPKDARKAGVTGITYYRVYVSALGAPTGCIVTTSSGSPVLDAKTCELIMARARFSPARDTRGQAIKGELDARVIWRF